LPRRKPYLFSSTKGQRSIPAATATWLLQELNQKLEDKIWHLLTAIVAHREPLTQGRKNSLRMVVRMRMMKETIRWDGTRSIWSKNQSRRFATTPVKFAVSNIRILISSLTFDIDEAKGVTSLVRSLDVFGFSSVNGQVMPILHVVQWGMILVAMVLLLYRVAAFKKFFFEEQNLGRMVPLERSKTTCHAKWFLIALHSIVVLLVRGESRPLQYYEGWLCTWCFQSIGAWNWLWNDLPPPKKENHRTEFSMFLCLSQSLDY
jgi:hypothetical protein